MHVLAFSVPEADLATQLQAARANLPMIWPPGHVSVSSTYIDPASLSRPPLLAAEICQAEETCDTVIHMPHNRHSWISRQTHQPILQPIGMDPENNALIPPNALTCINTSSGFGLMLHMSVAR
jgi:hypothetical protein